ncbi:MAG: hypothetical protein GXY83_36895 [Rhodopirellula sp.]|nr:hypothetical protein [Rhodopirellula sp.]
MKRCFADRDSIEYRCSACSAVEAQPLPRFPKKIIYLDQCALSNIVKEKNASWQKLHKNLEQLIGLQLIACPRSPIHYQESMLCERWRDQLQALYKGLAADDQFRSLHGIERAQLRKVLRCYLGQPESSDVKDRWREANTDDPHRFTGDMRVTCLFPTNELLVDGVKQEKQATHRRMQKLGDYWKQNPQSFRDAVEAEIEGYARSRIAAYRDLTDARKRMEGMLSWDLLETWSRIFRPDEFHPDKPPGSDPAVELVHLLACEVTKILPEQPDPIAVVEEFFNSKYMRLAPFLDISSRLWATIALQTQPVRTARKPKPSDTYDVEAVSHYAPYCDAMFLDNEFRAMASSGSVDVPKRFRVRLFSESNLAEFLNYLNVIQQCGVSPEHLTRLSLVYPEWAPLLCSTSADGDI